VRAIGRVFIFRLQIDDGLIPDCVPAPGSLMIICEVVSAQRTLGPGASVLCEQLRAKVRLRPQHNDNNPDIGNLSQLCPDLPRDYSNEGT